MEIKRFNDGHKVIYCILAFATMWYFYFASSFVLRPFPQLFWIAIVALSILLALLHRHKLSKMDCCFFASMSVLFFLSVTSSDIFGSLAVIGNYIIYYIAARMITKNCRKETIYNLILLFSIIHLICLYIQVLMPDVYTAVLLPLLPAYRQEEIKYQMNSNFFYYGFTVQSSISAMYLSVGLIITLLKVRLSREKSKQIIYIILSVLFLIALFFTGRRGSVAVSVFIIALMYSKSKRNVISKIFIAISLVVLVAYIGLDNIPGLNTILGKFEALLASGSLMNGRENTFAESFALFLDKPLFGYGIGQIKEALGYAWLENSYLLTLVEGGIFGFIALFAPVVLSIRYILFAIRKRGYSDFAFLFAVYVQILFVLMSNIENYFADPMTLFLYYAVVLSAIQFMKDRQSLQRN